MSMLFSRMPAAPTSGKSENEAAVPQSIGGANSSHASRAAHVRAQRNQVSDKPQSEEPKSAEKKPARDTLRRGASGPAVMELQQLLNASGIGVALAPDGNYGKATRAAVKAYQGSRGLRVDGVAGPQTWGALDSGAGAVSDAAQAAEPAGATDDADAGAAEPAAPPAPEPEQVPTPAPTPAVTPKPPAPAPANANKPKSEDKKPAPKPEQLKDKSDDEKKKVVEDAPAEPAKQGGGEELTPEDKSQADAIVEPVRLGYRAYTPVARESFKIVNKKGGEYAKIRPEIIRLEHELAAQIAIARAAIAGLASSAAKAYAYKKINQYSAFQYQIANANILHRDGTSAGGRTCNVTSVTMTLQALGKGPSDYQAADWSRMNKIAAAFQGQLAERGEGIDAQAMGMANFMQLVAIDRFLKGEPTEKNIAKARGQAASAITGSLSNLCAFLEAFGVSTSEHYHSLGGTLSAFSKVTKNSGNRSKDTKKRDSGKQDKVADWFADYGDAVKEVIADFKPLDAAVAAGNAGKTKAKDAVATIEQSLEKLPKSDSTPGIKKNVKKNLDAVPEKLGKDDAKGAKTKAGAAKKVLTSHETVKHQDAFEAAGSMDEMQKVMSVDKYQKGFLKKVTGVMDSGGQVVVNLQSHYVRLQSIESDGFIVDDPGKQGGNAFMVTWPEAIADGYFRKYVVITP